MPFSYAQYAGDGASTTFSVPFPYLLKAHVKLYTGYNILDGTFAAELTEGTDFTWTSDTQVQTTTAPAIGVTLTVLRDTPDGTLLVPWQDGSNLIAEDLNTSDLQNLYVVQEQQDRNDAGAAAAVAAQSAANSATAAAATATAAATAATTAANAATTAANASVAASTAATSTANTALSTANTAASNAAAAVTTANTAATDAAAAVATANAADADATAALASATAAASDAATALSTATSAASDASTALSTATSAASDAATALSTANTAATDAAAAVATANTAASDAAAAVTTANDADAKADQAIASVSAAVLFDLVANVAAIPASPANDDYIEVGDSTGIESFTPLAGLPSGFVGDAGLTVRLRYSTTGPTWNWLSYFANNSETRYLKKTNVATQAEAEAGTENTKYTTPLRVAQAIAALSPGGGATGGGDDQVFVENDQVVTTAYTIPTGKNASSVGPVSIDAGVTVTISANSTWVIL